MGNVVKIVLLLLLFSRFLGLAFIPVQPTAWDLSLFAIMALLVADCIKLKSLYAKIILAYIILILISCIYSNIFHHQNIIKVVSHCFNFLAVIFFFFLNSCRLSAREAEKTLIVFSVVFCLCYILQYLIYPTIIFSGSEHNVSIDVGHYRARLPASISSYCLLFYGMNKLLREHNYKYLLLSGLGFFPVIMMGFRSLIALSFFFLFIMIPFVIKRSGKTIVYSLIVAITTSLVVQTNLVQHKIEEMQRRTERGDTFQNEDYIRWQEFNYFWSQEFKDYKGKLIGNGLPSDNSSIYVKRIKSVEKLGFYWVDLGLVGLSIFIGIPAVLTLVTMYLLCIWRCKEPQFQYIRFTLIVVLIGSVITSMEIFRIGNILLLSIFLYIEYKYHQEQRIKEAKKIISRIEI